MDYLSFVNRFQCWGCSWHLPTSEIDLSGTHVWGQQSSVFCTSFYRLVLRIFSCLMIMQENLRKTEYITLYSRVSTSWRASWIRPWYLSSPHLQIQQSSEIKFIKLYVYLFLYSLDYSLLTIFSASDECEAIFGVAMTKHDWSNLNGTKEEVTSCQ